MSSTLIPLRPGRLSATAARRGKTLGTWVNRKARKANGADVGAVYEQIWTAIIDHSLPPQTRLVEERLCEIFGLGRTRLREVLQRLAHERVVTLLPNRGAAVSKPSVREAHEVFVARELLEAGTVAGFIRSATRADCKRLHQHLAREHAAWRQGNRRAAEGDRRFDTPRRNAAELLKGCPSGYQGPGAQQGSAKRCGEELHSGST